MTPATPIREEEQKQEEQLDSRNPNQRGHLEFGRMAPSGAETKECRKAGGQNDGATATSIQALSYPRNWGKSRPSTRLSFPRDCPTDTFEPFNGERLMKDLLLKFLGYPRSVRVALARKIIRRFSLFSYRDRLASCAVERPHYGHCIFEAAQLAARLNYPRISVIEFGCGGGNGLRNAEMHIAEITRIFPIEIELYGFDTGEGLPSAQDYRDFAHYFKEGLYKMDPRTLKNKLRIAKLVLGDVGKTCKTFFEEYKPAPIGCVFHDLDYYSSTRDALTLFEADAAHFLPRVFMYFDDIKGNNTWLVSEFAGELLAIEEFNKKHFAKKIAANRCMPLMYPDQWWAHSIYIYHDFQHPRYNDFVGADDQVQYELDIRLQ